jgi:hypothetical protein
MFIPGPADVQAVLNLFLLFDPAAGIEELIKHVDLTNFDRRRTYQTVLGRIPENAAVSHTAEDFDAREQFIEALQSREFRQNLVKLIYRAFPRHRRITFLHVPKCAGTDLIRKFDNKYPSINNTLTSEKWIDSTGLFSAIKRIVAEIHCCDTIFVYGHMRLIFLIRQELIRSTDEAFTVLRDPLDMTLSQVNYVVTRLLAAAASPASATWPDLADWLKALDLESVPQKLSAKDQVKLAKRVLRTARLVNSNVICSYLGHQQAPTTVATAESALNNLVMTNLEITDTTRYNAWLEKKFGIASTTRLNKSRHILTRENITGAEREYIMSITEEDRVLYAAVTGLLTGADALSVRGNSLMSAVVGKRS